MKFITLLLLLISSSVSFAQESTSKDKINQEVVYNRDAEFPGGQAAMDMFITQNMRYPKESVDNNEQGTIAVMFTVEADGTLTNIKAGTNTTPRLAEEAIRIFTIMPKWEPAIMNGNAIKQELYSPIIFQM